MQGWHLIAQATGIEAKPGALGLFLAQAVEVTGLTAISPVFVDDQRGVGFVIIAESHVSIHLKGDRAWADVFSCRRFEAEPILRILQKLFAGEWVIEILRRDVTPPRFWRGGR